MNSLSTVSEITARHILTENHAASDYFAAIRELVTLRSQATADKKEVLQAAIDRIYGLLHEEILTNRAAPVTPVTFGTSGWRGILGKDLNIFSVACVTAAILTVYRDMAGDPALSEALGVSNFDEMRQRGCVIGFDNRFDGATLALAAANVLAEAGVKIYYAGEATTGTLSASVLERNAAFSINLTPSHNPLEYSGFKYNAADAGPAAPVITDRITKNAAAIIAEGASPLLPNFARLQRPLTEIADLEPENALASWQSLVRKNVNRHGLDYDSIIMDFATNPDLVVVIDCVHGAARTNILDFFKGLDTDRLIILRGDPDVTFGGIAPEPSSANMAQAIKTLRQRPEPFKLGAIIDPDGDRIRFTDGATEISMNQFGAMAYHFLHEIKKKKGMVAKTVASSNLANAVASALQEEIFEPRVGFKEFKPVLDQALVCFEESDGITVIGHTPEKDAYIGLLLAMDMVLTLNKNLGDYLEAIENSFGTYFPGRGGVEVSLKGEELLAALAGLEKYDVGAEVRVGNAVKRIREVITIDGRKMIFEDNSWVMIRPSGTEPKVRFYVEARSGNETELLLQTAQSMLAEIGLVA